MALDNTIDNTIKEIVMDIANEVAKNPDKLGEETDLMCMLYCGLKHHNKTKGFIINTSDLINNNNIIDMVIKDKKKHYEAIIELKISLSRQRKDKIRLLKEDIEKRRRLRKNNMFKNHTEKQYFIMMDTDKRKQELITKQDIRSLSEKGIRVIYSNPLMGKFFY